MKSIEIKHNDLRATPLISVIIPIYRVENYLCRCLDSVLSSTYYNLEIILVEDGSPDNCGKICDEYAAKDSRITVIHQENKGVSAARNAGLRIATGEFISFIDSDDYVDKNFFKVLLDGIGESDADIAVCRYSIVPETASTTYAPPYSTSGRIYALDEVIKDHGVRTCVWNKLYSSRILSGFTFVEEIRSAEDVCFNFAVIFQDLETKVWVTEAQLYYYVMRDTSTMHTVSQSALLHTVPYLISLANKADNEKLKWILCYQAFKNTWSGRYYSMYLPDKKEKYDYAEHLLYECTKLMHTLPSTPLKEKLICYVFSRSPWMYRQFRRYDDKTLLQWEKEAKQKNTQ